MSSERLKVRLDVFPPEELAAKVNELGGANKAAEVLRTSPSKISRYLNDHGFFSKPQYVKEVQTLQTT